MSTNIFVGCSGQSGVENVLNTSNDCADLVYSTIVYKNKKYALIFQSAGMFLFEEETQKEWRNYLVYVSDRNDSPYEVSWNGQRFVECHAQERFRRQAAHAERWTLAVLKEHRSSNSEKSGNSSHPLREVGVNQTPRVAAFDLLLFDLDNTLVKSDDLASFRGSEFCGTLPAGYLRSLREALIDDPGRAIYSEEYLLQLLSIFPTLRLAVVTQAPRGYAATILSSLYSRIPWTLLVAFDDVIRGKPDPEGIYKAMEAAGVTDLGRVALVGDTVRDIQTAYFAGCWAVLDRSGWDTYNRPAIEKVPDVIIRQPHDLVDVVENPCNYLPALEKALHSRDARHSPDSFRVDRIQHTFPGQPSRAATVHVLGRSFSRYRSLDIRRSWHPLTAEIQRLKDAKEFPDAWISSLCFYLQQHVVLKNRLSIIVTAIPAKPDRIPRLQYLVDQVEIAYSAAHPEDLNRVAFRPDLLIYTEGVRSHHGEHLGRAERFSNVQQHLAVNQSINFKGHFVVVIDDVVTTGATLLVAKLALISSGAKQVRCVALAKAVGER